MPIFASQYRCLFTNKKSELDYDVQTKTSALTKKKLMARLVNLFVKTGTEWKNIAEEDREGKDVINNFTLPLMGFSTIAIFLGSLINNEGFDFETAIKISFTSFLSIYLSVYVSMFLINAIKSFFQLPSDNSKTLIFIGYAYALYIVIELITGLIPEFFMLKILILYTIYIVWEGVVPIFNIKEEQRTGFSLICVAILLVIPFIIDKILFYLIPGNAVV